MSFRRALTGDMLRLWLELVGRVCAFFLKNQCDKFRWNLTKNNNFTVGSMYKDVMEKEEALREKLALVTGVYRLW
jgi:hypothetical protein